MKREVMAASLFLASCAPGSGWPPPETGFRCVPGDTSGNAVLLANERDRLDLVGNQRNIDLLIVNEEYGRRGREAGCSPYDFFAAQREMERRDNPEPEDTI